MHNYSQHQKLVDDLKNQLLTLVKNKYGKNDRKIIVKALKYAEEAHRNQKRKNDEPYITHPIATALKLIEWGMDFESVAAGLLHDVIEDSNVSYQQLLLEFGDNIAIIVKTVSKVTKYSKRNREDINKNSLNNSYVIQVFLSMSQDLRAIVVKLADRMHNMETIHNLSTDKQISIAKETLEIYAVIAGRMGMYNIKTQLEDMCFRIIDPNSYSSIYKHIKKLEDNIKDTWRRIQTQIRDMLDVEGIVNKTNYRLKGIYSIWKKMEKGYLPENIHDVFAMRIIVKTELECYWVLGLIHLNFIYIINTFKDFISLPKWNLYRSIHTTVVVNKFLIEFQIRTEEMHEISQMGLAAHWKYKEGERYVKISQKMIEQFLQGRDASIEVIKEIAKTDLFDVYVSNDDQFYVCTSQTTLLDLACRYDLDRFSYLDDVFLNGENVSFDTRVKKGDFVQFKYGAVVKIKPHWVTATKNINTINHINAIFKTQEENLKLTVDKFLEQVQKHLKLDEISEKNYKQRLSYLSYKNLEEFVDDLSRLNLKKEDIYNFFAADEAVWKRSFKLLKKQLYYKVFWDTYFEPPQGISPKQIINSECCSKIPNQQLVGVLKNNILKVHSYYCQQSDAHHGKRIFINWNQKTLLEKPTLFEVKMTIFGYNTPTIGNQIIQMILKHKVVIEKFELQKVLDPQRYRGDIIIKVDDYNQLEKMINNLKVNGFINEFEII